MKPDGNSEQFHALSAISPHRIYGLWCVGGIERMDRFWTEEF